MLCERCCALIADDEPVVRLFSSADGEVGGYRYLHLGGSSRCVPPRLVPQLNPDCRQSTTPRPGD